MSDTQSGTSPVQGRQSAKRALICGIGGQDGAYLAAFLLNKGYEVSGTSRGGSATGAENLKKIGVFEKVDLFLSELTDHRQIVEILGAARPEEIYNLAGQSSVGSSFDQPLATINSISLTATNLLEAVRVSGCGARIFMAGSGESFGEANEEPHSERSLFQPCSPYAVGKVSSFWQTAVYRDSFGLFACTGILFNHESPLRPERFVTRKIASAACRIARGSKEKLQLGNLLIIRDWGWAPEYVAAMWSMLQNEIPSDFVIGTGRSYSLQDFVKVCFSCVDLDWREHVVIDPALFRRSELQISRADPAKAERLMAWQAERAMPDVVRLLVASELAKTQEGESKEPSPP